MMILILLLKYSIVCICTYIALNIYIFVNRRQYRKFKSPKIPKTPFWFMGHIPGLQQKINKFPDKGKFTNMYDYLDELSCDMLVLFFFAKSVVICKDLQIIPTVLNDRSTFLKAIDLSGNFEIIAGVRFFGKHGLINDIGTNVWKSKRRIMDFAFKKAFLKTTVDSMGPVVRKLIRVLRTKADTGSVFDIGVFCDRMALEGISICGFDWDSQMMQEIGDMPIQTAHSALVASSIQLNHSLAFKLPWTYKAEKEEVRKLLPPMRGFMKKHLENVQKSSLKNDNILSHIIRANQVSDHLTIENLVDEYFVFLVAGMETTSTTMACAIWFISTYPRVYKKLQAEVDEVYGDKDELEFEDFGKLSYLEMVIKETLRLKGPVHGVSAECPAGASVNDHYFPKGTIFFIAFKSIHVDPRHWENPQDFIPERFSRESRKNIIPHSYLPFSSGPRNCIGKNFAMLELKFAISKVMKKFVIVNPDHDVKELPMLCTITERPKYGVNIKLFSK